MCIENTQTKNKITIAITRIILRTNKSNNRKGVLSERCKNSGYISQSNKNRKNIVHRNSDISRKLKYYGSG